MKRFRYILAIAAILVGGASCEVIQEDAFSTDPAAPEFMSHGDILMTANTMDEDVNFTWTAYKYLPEGLTYTLKATYLYDTKVLATTSSNIYKTTKREFKNLLYTTFPNLPVNDTFVLTFEVSVLDGADEYTSNAMPLTIYAYGDAVAPAITLTADELELDPARAMDEITLIEWEPARLAYGEEVNYNVWLSTKTSDMLATKAASATDYLLAEGLKETRLVMTVDAFNEAVIAAGGAEDADVPVKFLVEAFSASLPEGIEASSAEMTVSTYLATFPERIYLAGSFQGWDPASGPSIAQSTERKGYYEGIVDLTTEDGSDVEFKFCTGPDWGDAAAGDNFGASIERGDKDGVYYYAHGTAGDPAIQDNIKMPSGVYVVMLDKKVRELRLVSIESLGMIGTAVGGWDKEVAMEWDKETNVFSVATDIVPGEYKFRLNDDWDFSIDASNGVNGSGSNYSTDMSGNYKISVDMSSHPYKVKFANTSFPEQLYVPGSHNGWEFAVTTLSGDGEGHYEGYTSVGGEWGFKLTATQSWDTQWGLGEVLETSAAGETTYEIVPNGGNIMEGSEVTYARVQVDLDALTVKVLPIHSVEICGGFTAWGVDEKYFLTYDAEDDSWFIQGVEIPKNAEWKFRMNDDGDWTANLGGALDNLTQNGNNITGTEPGVYTIRLYISHAPYHATLTKTGDVDAPALPETMYIIGNDFGSWNWDSDGVVTMTPVNGHEGGFWAIRYMTAATEFKFNANRAWDGSEFCKLGTNEGFTTPGNNMVEADGLYIICVDAKNDKVTVEPAEVWGFGPCFGGWEAEPKAFSPDASGQKMVSPALEAGDLRMYTKSACFSDAAWWQMEFNLYDGKIVYRGAGGDQAPVPCTAGQVVTLDFNTESGTIQ